MRIAVIGHAAVDSGTLLVVDPCYITGETDSQPVWDATDSRDQGGAVLCAGIAGNGVAFASGYGDGVYPVVAHIANDEETGGWGERVVKVEIIMDTEMFPVEGLA